MNSKDLAETTLSQRDRGNGKRKQEREINIAHSRISYDLSILFCPNCSLAPSIFL
jgi:hypothetical protein